jgi:hypothetical protein
MWVADTLLMANPYSVFGAVALPLPTTANLSNGVMLLRAGLIGFGFTFGLKAAGSQFRDITEEHRENRPAVGVAADVAVIGTLAAGGVWLATAAAKLQEVFLSLSFGATQVHVPNSVLFAIVGFLGVVSFATGFFSNEPELERAAEHDAAVDAATQSRKVAAEQLAFQRGAVRGLRKQLANLGERMQLEVKEQDAHTDARVKWHMHGNRPIYGLEIETEAGAVRGEKDDDDPDSPDSPDAAPLVPVVPFGPTGPAAPAEVAGEAA